MASCSCNFLSSLGHGRSDRRTDLGYTIYSYMPRKHQSRELLPADIRHEQRKRIVIQAHDEPGEVDIRLRLYERNAGILAADDVDRAQLRRVVTSPAKGWNARRTAARDELSAGTTSDKGT